MTPFQQRVLASLTVVPDFPKPGVQFRDITPLLMNPPLFAEVVDAMAERASASDVIAGIDARGFVFAAAVAHALRKPLALFRKTGKLPRETHSASFSKEYGDDRIHLHRDSVGPGQRVTIVDDVLATGGTAAAAGEIVRAAGGIPSYVFLGEIPFLGGRSKVTGEIFSIVEM